MRAGERAGANAGRHDLRGSRGLPQAGAIAMQGIRDKGQVQPGQKVLINGAGGGSGMYAIQLAKLYGAEVTGVDNAEKLEFMRSLGADHVIDYTREDFTRNGRTYDLILDLAAYRSAFAYRRSLTPEGTVSVCWRIGGDALPGPADRALDRRTAGQEDTHPGRSTGAQHLAPMVELCQAGKITTVIDRRYPLSEVAEALRYLGEGHAKGKIIVYVD